MASGLSSFRAQSFILTIVACTMLSTYVQCAIDTPELARELLTDEDRQFATEYHLPLYSFVATNKRLLGPVRTAANKIAVLNDLLREEPLQGFLKAALEDGSTSGASAEVQAQAQRALEAQKEASAAIGFRSGKAEESVAGASLGITKSSARMRELRGSLICNNFIFKCNFHQTRNIMERVTIHDRLVRMWLSSKASQKRRDDKLKSCLNWAIWRESRSPISEPLSARDGTKYIKGYTEEVGMGSSFGLQAPTSKDINPVLRQAKGFGGRYGQAARKLDDEMATYFNQGMYGKDEHALYRMVGSIGYFQNVGGMDVYIEDAYLSTTSIDLEEKARKKNLPNDVADCREHCGYILKIVGKVSGRYIGSISSRTYEVETLFRPGTVFVVVNKPYQVRKNGPHFLELMEVSNVYDLFTTPSASTGWRPLSMSGGAEDGDGDAR